MSDERLLRHILDDLQPQLRKLAMLLEDRHFGLATWMSFLHEQLQSVHKLAGEAIGEPAAPSPAPCEAIEAIREENARLRAALGHTFAYLDTLDAKLPPEDHDKLRGVRIHIRAALARLEGEGAK